MHGNESTTTRAFLDVLNFLNHKHELANELLQHLTITFIPQLNPDGSQLFTRVNRNGIDLNRDALEMSQPESEVLRRVFDDIGPDYCFNLHDQRSIFGVGSTGTAATLSFLAPSANLSREITNSRAVAMQIIAGIHDRLNSLIPGGIGRFDDSFNPNCVGDQFQMQGVPTILFEAGHYAQDYDRATTRKLLFYAFLEAFCLISKSSFDQFTVHQYFEIPENEKNFVDIHVFNPHLIDPKAGPESVLKLQYEEQLQHNNIVFAPKYLEATSGSGIFAHRIVNCAIEQDRNWISTHSLL
jgi:hypothetical protein